MQFYSIQFSNFESRMIKQLFVGPWSCHELRRQQPTISSWSLECLVTPFSHLGNISSGTHHLTSIRSVIPLEPHSLTCVRIFMRRSTTVPYQSDPLSNLVKAKGVKDAIIRHNEIGYMDFYQVHHESIGQRVNPDTNTTLYEYGGDQGSKAAPPGLRHVCVENTPPQQNIVFSDTVHACRRRLRSSNVEPKSKN
jgi:hypothetical protein